MSRNEGYRRLEITLSEDALALLDRIQQSGDFTSKSRALEELVFAIDDLMSYIKNIMALVPEDKEITEDLVRNTTLIIALRLQKFGLLNAIKQYLPNQKSGPRYY